MLTCRAASDHAARPLSGRRRMVRDRHSGAPRLGPRRPIGKARRMGTWENSVTRTGPPPVFVGLAAAAPPVAQTAATNWSDGQRSTGGGAKLQRALRRKVRAIRALAVSTDRIVESLSPSETGQLTITGHVADGITCLMAAGEHFEALAPAPPGASRMYAASRVSPRPTAVSTPVPQRRIGHRKNTRSGISAAAPHLRSTPPARANTGFKRRERSSQEGLRVNRPIHRVIAAFSAFTTQNTITEVASGITPSVPCRLCPSMNTAKGREPARTCATKLVKPTGDPGKPQPLRGWNPAPRRRSRPRASAARNNGNPTASTPAHRSATALPRPTPRKNSAAPAPAPGDRAGQDRACDARACQQPQARRATAPVVADSTQGSISPSDTPGSTTMGENRGPPANPTRSAEHLPLWKPPSQKRPHSAATPQTPIVQAMGFPFQGFKQLDMVRVGPARRASADHAPCSGLREPRGGITPVADIHTRDLEDQTLNWPDPKIALIGAGQSAHARPQLLAALKELGDVVTASTSP